MITAVFEFITCILMIIFFFKMIISIPVFCGPNTPLHCTNEQVLQVFVSSCYISRAVSCSAEWTWRVTVLLRVTGGKDLFTTCSCFKREQRRRRGALISAGALHALHISLFFSFPLLSGPPLVGFQFENRTPPSVYSFSPGGRFFIPEITGTRVPPVYFLYRRHFTRHQSGRLNHTTNRTTTTTTSFSKSLAVSPKHLSATENF